MSKLVSFNLPIMEIHSSNEPIALIYLPGRRIKPFKVKPIRGKYFVLYNKFIKGIFEMDEDHTYYWGKTPIYHYHFASSTPMDPVMVDEINKYCRTNKLTKIKRKDVKHGSSLRNIFTKNKNKDPNESLDILDNSQEQEGEQMETGIEDGLEDMKNYVEETNKEREDKQKIVLTEEHQSIFLLKYLQEKKLIEAAENDTFVYKIQNGLINFTELIDELKSRKVIEINVPLSLNAQVFLEDFGSQNPAELAGLIDDLRTNKKELKNLTATPVKQWMPASIVLALILGGAMAVVLIGQNPEIFENIIGGLPSMPSFLTKYLVG